MRVVFMGTPAFAVPALETLADAHDVVGVFTRKDAVSGRGSHVRPCPVALAAAARGLKVVQPSTLSDGDVLETLRAMRPDVIVVAAYGLILPREVLDAAPLGALNIHASLLPRWRGAAPVQRAILAGDLETGVSIMRMEEGLDTGPYCQVRRTPVDDKNAAELTEELAQLGAAAILDALDDLAAGQCDWQVQDESLVTYAHKVTKDDVAIGPDLTVQDALRRIRASSPQAPTRIRVGSAELTVVSGRGCDSVVEQGTAQLTAEGLVFGLADGSILVARVKPAGRSEMDSAAWARGLREPVDLRWCDAR